MAATKAKKEIENNQTDAGSRSASNGVEAQVYNITGKEAGKIQLSESVFGLPWNADLVHQVVISMEANKRTPVAHTKNRGEVSGGGKKPWQQKGTGRARHGSIRSPIWVKGGVSHGPRNDKDFSSKINKKMKAKALYTILSRKLKQGEVLFVNDLSLKAPKTKEAKEILSSLSKISGFEPLLNKRKNSAYIALDIKDKNTEKSFRNFGNMHVDEIRNLNPVSLMKYKYVVISNPEKSLTQISGKMDK